MADEHINFLQFLWWKDGDFNTKPVAYETSHHIFGGISSPICNNCSPRRIAVADQSKLRSEAANNLNKNFFMEDMFKPVTRVPEEVSLIKNLKTY